MYRGYGGLRTRGGRGGRFVSKAYSNPLSSRSDQNFFAVLSDTVQDGGHWPDSGDKDTGVDAQGYTLVRKRQRISTGGESNEQIDNCDTGPDPVIVTNFEEMDNDQKLSAIFATLTCNQNNIRNVEKKLNTIGGLNGRMTQAETVIRSYNDRLKLLEFKSIDIEARSRRNNLLFKGLKEERDEDCRRKVLNFLQNDLHMEEMPTIERIHRLGRYNPSKGPRPIIVAFSFFRDTEEIMGNARLLRDTSYGISRDHPPEIARARQKLWPQFKAARINQFNCVSIGYPAKLIVNGTVVCDMFPEWDSIMKGSRVSLQNQPGVSIPERSNPASTQQTPTFGANSGILGATAVPVIPGTSTYASAAKHDNSLHEYMDLESTQDPNSAKSPQSERNSPSLINGSNVGHRAWNAHPRFTMTPVLNDQFHSNEDTPNSYREHAPPPQSDLTSSPHSLADKLIRASKFDTPGTVKSNSGHPPPRSPSENGRATSAARPHNTESTTRVTDSSEPK